MDWLLLRIPLKGNAESLKSYYYLKIIIAISKTKEYFILSKTNYYHNKLSLSFCRYGSGDGHRNIIRGLWDGVGNDIFLPSDGVKKQIIQHKYPWQM